MKSASTTILPKFASDEGRETKEALAEALDEDEKEKAVAYIRSLEQFSAHLISPGSILLT